MIRASLFLKFSTCLPAFLLSFSSNRSSLLLLGFLTDPRVGLCYTFLYEKVGNTALGVFGPRGGGL